MAAPTWSELQRAPSSRQELNKSADGSGAKGYCWKMDQRLLATETLDNLRLLMEVVRHHPLSFEYSARALVKNSLSVACLSINQSTSA